MISKIKIYDTAHSFCNTPIIIDLYYIYAIINVMIRPDKIQRRKSTFLNLRKCNCNFTLGGRSTSFKVYTICTRFEAFAAEIAKIFIPFIIECEILPISISIYCYRNKKGASFKECPEFKFQERYGRQCLV